MIFYKRNKIKEKEKWHLWFAWHPVKIKTTPDGDGRFAFFEMVKRCGEHVGLIMKVWVYEYKEISKEDKK